MRPGLSACPRIVRGYYSLSHGEDTTCRFEDRSAAWHSFLAVCRNHP
jgi:hypothetical protein